ncbi:MAG: hypothetical protein ACOYXU_03135 [Nitrospirota bacterium]
MDKPITLLIFLYWLVYENIMFFYSMEYGGPIFYMLTNGIKLFVPVVLLFLTGLPSRQAVRRVPVSLYLLSFAVFLIWGLVPTVVAGDVVEWFKLLPRAAFLLSVIAFFSQRPTAFALFAKCMVAYVILLLPQYVLIYLTSAYEDPLFTGYAYMAGPLGMLGNITSTFYLPEASFPFIRLTGFWNEPSNASGCAFAAFFLARYLVAMGGGAFWHSASYACLIAGVLALSLAGYFALGSALLVGLLFGVKRVTPWRVIRFSLLFPVAVGLLGIVVFGRSYVAEHYLDNIWLRAIVGVRDAGTEAASYDASDGRLAIAEMTVEKAASTVIGVGIQEVGINGIIASASAPLFWLLLTGFPGFFLLLSREAVLLVHSRSLLHKKPTVLPLIQALIVVMAQHVAYGTWMNPNYFILAGMVLVVSPKQRYPT